MENVSDLCWAYDSMGHYLFSREPLSEDYTELGLDKKKPYKINNKITMKMMIQRHQNNEKGFIVGGVCADLIKDIKDFKEKK